MTEENKFVDYVDCAFGKLPDHLLIDIFVRVPISEWSHIACVKKQWAIVLQGEGLWRAALLKAWPSARHRKRWPGPIPQGLSRRWDAYMLFRLSHIYSLFCAIVQQVVFFF